MSLGNSCSITGPCEKNKCLNDGICEENGDEFNCVCTDKFHGQLCEKEKGKNILKYLLSSNVFLLSLKMLVSRKNYFQKFDNSSTSWGRLN